jgi:hypothetical protein
LHGKYYSRKYCYKGAEKGWGKKKDRKNPENDFE